MFFGIDYEKVIKTVKISKELRDLLSVTSFLSFLVFPYILQRMDLKPAVTVKEWLDLLS